MRLAQWTLELLKFAVLTSSKVQQDVQLFAAHNTAVAERFLRDARSTAGLPVWRLRMGGAVVLQTFHLCGNCVEICQIHIRYVLLA